MCQSSGVKVGKRGEALIERVLAHATRVAGVSVGELLSVEGIDCSRRTLQRRLEGLVVDGKLGIRGEGRGRRYFVPEVSVIGREVGTWGSYRGDPRGVRAEPDRVFAGRFRVGLPAVVPAVLGGGAFARRAGPVADDLPGGDPAVCP